MMLTDAEAHNHNDADHDVDVVCRRPKIVSMKLVNIKVLMTMVIEDATKEIKT